MKVYTSRATEATTLYTNNFKIQVLCVINIFSTYI